MDAYIGEIRLMPYNFAPRNWMQCLGQTLSISQNTALFSILGTTYGGNGSTTFGLPNFSGTAAIGAGSNGQSDYPLGTTAGSATVALTEATLPAHAHLGTGTLVTGKPSTATMPGGYVGPGTGELYGDTAGTNNMAAGAVSGGPTAPAGAGNGHNNMMPFVVLNFCICTNGIFPPRS